MNLKSRYVRIWIGGFVLSTCLMWGGSRYFITSVRDYRWDESLGEYVPKAGQRFQLRSEGWATTSFGKHYIPVVDIGASDNRFKIALWGDSQAEALCVADEDKPAQQVTRLWAEQGSAPTLVCAATARSAWTLVDIIDRLPTYQSIAKFDAHYILLSSLGDVMPDESKFVSKPAFALVPAKRTVPGVRLFPLVTKSRTEFLYWTARLAVYGAGGSSMRRLRFSVGPVVSPPVPASFDVTNSTPIPVGAWDFLLGELKKQSAKPFVFVYVPRVPRIKDGRIETDNPERRHVEAFSAECAQHGIRLLDLSDEFARVVRQSGRFPRGFHNGVVSVGHINELGHSLIARAICEDLRNHLVRDAL